MVLAALLTAQVVALPADALTLYQEIQSRVAKSVGIRHHDVTGSDSWDSDIDVDYFPPNRYTLGMKNRSIYCDGKWYLESELGEVRHHPFQESDLIYLGFPARPPGFEAMFPGAKPLEVYGAVDEVKYGIPANPQPMWRIRYRSSEGEKELLIDPRTRLPLKFGLIPKGTPPPAPVPTERTESQVLADAARALKRPKQILLSRNLDGDRNRNSIAILLTRGRPPKTGQLTRTAEGKLMLSKNVRSVTASSLGLRGFEPFFGKKLSASNKLVRLTSLYDSDSIAVWPVSLHDKGGPITVYFHEAYGWGGYPDLPSGYQILEKGKPIKTVTYTIHWVSSE